MSIALRTFSAVRRARTALPSSAQFARCMAGSAAPQEVDLSVYKGPSIVARLEPKIEMGVRYEVRVPSPQESIDMIPPIVVSGTLAKCDGGGGALGHPVEFIRLDPRSDEPAVCKYCGLRFISAGGH